MRKGSIGLAISAAAISAAVTFILTSYFTLQSFNKKISNVNNLSETYVGLKELDDYVRENYYSDVDDENINNGILKGYVAGLDDKFSRYLTADEYSEYINTESGTTKGIGISVTRTDDDYLKIETVTDGSPAQEVGINEGDIIVAIDGTNISRESFEEAIGRIRGNEGSKIKLTLLRNGVTSDVTVTRKTFEIKTVKYLMLDNKVGYIRISAFRTATIDQFNTALSALEKGGAKSYILDVRGNKGGLLSALEKVADPLLPEGEIAVATYTDDKTETIMTSDAECIEKPFYVLVDGTTASAAELFACSLRDFSGAVLVGEKTYGKGVMQNTVELSNGGAVTLTVATYQTTKSECYNLVGLEPDEEVKAGENTDITAIDPGTDPQLSKALELAK